MVNVCRKGLRSGYKAIRTNDTVDPKKVLCCAALTALLADAQAYYGSTGEVSSNPALASSLLPGRSLRDARMACLPDRSRT